MRLDATSPPERRGRAATRTNRSRILGRLLKPTTLYVDLRRTTSWSDDPRATDLRRIPGIPVVSPLGAIWSRGTKTPRLRATPKAELEWGEQTLKQVCFQEYPEAQHAFKDLMIHGILQFTLRIAFRCVLHRCENQDIHC